MPMWVGVQCGDKAYTLERGFSLMNEYITRFAQQVTLHSVSYTPMMFPEPGGYRVWIYATVVYSGAVDPVDFFNVEPKEGGITLEKTRQCCASISDG